MPAVRTWMVGRVDTCAIVVDDEYASAVHCRIDQLEDGRVVVADLGSTSGTRIKGADGVIRPVYGPQVIRDNETLIVGRSELSWDILRRAVPTT